MAARRASAKLTASSLACIRSIGVMARLSSRSEMSKSASSRPGFASISFGSVALLVSIHARNRRDEYWANAGAHKNKLLADACVCGQCSFWANVFPRRDWNRVTIFGRTRRSALPNCGKAALRRRPNIIRASPAIHHARLSGLRANHASTQTPRAEVPPPTGVRGRGVFRTPSDLR